MLKLIHKTLQWFFMRVEGLFNIAFGDKLNPLYHLGTITFFQFWLVSDQRPLPVHLRRHGRQ
jgi:CDP-4-dehydro-6-deoxyglucose reductase